MTETTSDVAAAAAAGPKSKLQLYELVITNWPRKEF